MRRLSYLWILAWTVTSMQLEPLSAIQAVQDPAFNLDFQSAKSLLSQILIPRPPQSANLSKVLETISGRFESLGKRSRERVKGDQAFWFEARDSFISSTPVGDRQFTNLVYTHNPQAGSKLVLACHTDTIEGMPNYVGATDSAVPCAILVDVAEALSDWLDEREMFMSEDDQMASTTLCLIFFDGEEAFKSWSATDSTYGSRHLAKVWSEDPIDLPSASFIRPRTAIQQISHFILLDLLGSPGPTIRSFYRDTGWLFDAFIDAEDRLGKAGILYEGVDGDAWSTKDFTALGPASPSTRSFFKSRNDMAGIYGGHVEDDHLPFLALGVPILHLIPIPFPQVWHTNNDDAAHLDFPTIRAWSLLTRLVVAEYLQLGAHAKQKRDELVTLAFFCRKEAE